MDVGMAAIFQNPKGARTDLEVYQNDLRLAELAEPLGFDSIWGVEHHFTDYTMCPDVYQYLAYMAGRTKHIKLGSMVIVLPWHDPLRAAEEISMLDNMTNGRVILGIGRGAGKVEFDGFRQDMGDSRERFVEYAEMILEGLEKGYVEYDGKFIKQPKTDIRPRPFKSFRNRTYAAAVSPQSSQIMAKLGVGILIIPQKPWKAVVEELAEYRATYRQVNNGDAPPTILGGWTFCDEDEGRAEEMARKYIGGYWNTVLEHYRFHEGHLKTMKGYEYYGKFADQIQKSGLDAAIDFFMSIQVWGTPEQCYQKILKSADRVGADSFNAVFSYAGMPWDIAEKNQRLFAKEVLPELKKIRPVAERLKQAAE
jgi:alkanesulfonate monooxygenase SsuD/methylene tetrahydromethanopterin reductase-like flavin-dependent oxidoreductase (luciferase family)